MTRFLVRAVCSLALAGCGESGGDDGGGAESGSSPSCSIGLGMTGEVTGSFSVGDDATCLVSLGSTESIDVMFGPGHTVQWIEVRIGNVMEAQTGSGFPTGVVVTLEDGTHYATSNSGCTASITEHALESTETTPIGEQRHYRVVGTGSCGEVASNPSAPGAGVTLSNLAFRIPAVWHD